MSGSFRDRLRKAPAATERFTADLIRELAPKVLFFFVAFLLIFVLFRLFVQDYSPVTFPAFTRAAVAALILGKVIPLLEWAESGHRFETHRRISVIVAKTLAYAMVVIVLGTCERLFEDFRTQGSFGAAMQTVIAHVSFRHFLGLVLLLGMVVGSFLTWQEIDDALGQGAFLRLLLERRATKHGEAQ